MAYYKCETCEHFVQHYGIFNGRLETIFCGHCLRREIKRKIKSSCELYIEKEYQSENKLKLVANHLADISNKLAKLLQMLNTSD